MWRGEVPVWPGELREMASPGVPDADATAALLAVIDFALGVAWLREQPPAVAYSAVGDEAAADDEVEETRDASAPPDVPRRGARRRSPSPRA